MKPQRVLEIGTNVGGSTLYIAAALRRIDASANITTVDIEDVNADRGPWRVFGLAKSPLDHANELALHNITFVADDSINFMSRQIIDFDLIFLDGNHAASKVYEEISAALKILKENGTILLHDYYPGGKRLRPHRAVIGGPYHAVERIKRENPHLDVFPLGSISGSGIYSTPSSLAVLGQAS